MKDYDAAIREYLKAIEIRSDHQESRLNLANTYRSLGRVSESVPHHAWVAAQRNDVQLYGVLAEDAPKAGRPDDARWYAALQRNPKDGEAHARLGKLLLDRDECKAAKAHLQQATRLRPQDAGVREALARARARCP
jgi:Flp pilus assembly protein TadD